LVFSRLVGPAFSFLILGRTPPTAHLHLLQAIHRIIEETALPMRFPRFLTGPRSLHEAQLSRLFLLPLRGVILSALSRLLLSARALRRLDRRVCLAALFVETARFKQEFSDFRLTDDFPAWKQRVKPRNDNASPYRAFATDWRYCARVARSSRSTSTPAKI
jgi:hypothetical protein